MNTAIIEKIQKLFQLANSDNQHEAELAAKRANELLLKYNLSIQDVERHDGDYVDTVVMEDMGRMSYYQRQIIGIVNEYFFTRAIVNTDYTTWPRKKKIKLIGLPENCKVASYVYDYLMIVYPKLWKQYKESNAFQVMGRNGIAKKSFYAGLSMGIEKVLRETRFKVQEETGLVLVNDKQLEAAVNKRTNGSSYQSQKPADLIADVFHDGVKQGLKVQLRKPIENKRNEGEIKHLGYKKE